jgi:hypothetical protein
MNGFAGFGTVYLTRTSLPTQIILNLSPGKSRHFHVYPLLIDPGMVTEEEGEAGPVLERVPDRLGDAGAA